MIPQRTVVLSALVVLLDVMRPAGGCACDRIEVLVQDAGAADAGSDSGIDSGDATIDSTATETDAGTEDAVDGGLTPAVDSSVPNDTGAEEQMVPQDAAGAVDGGPAAADSGDASA